MVIQNDQACLNRSAQADDEEDYLDCKMGGYMGRRTVESLSSSIDYLDNELY